MSQRSSAVVVAAFLAAYLSASGQPARGSTPSRSGGATSAAAHDSSPRKIEVLVVGTIHQRHGTDENYSYADIVQILAGYNPDLICVEIRPQDFRKAPYLKEMMLATIWGLARGKVVAPIDWWDDAQNVREIRDKLAKQPEYLEKDKQEKALLAQSPIVAGFEKIYGPSDAESKWSAHLGYAFWNGRDFNEFYAEVYRISMQVYGDSPFNLYYQTRNGRMMELISKAIRDGHGRRVIVLTGAEHKHFFDRELRRNPKVENVDFASLLPLEKRPLPPEVVRFLDEDDDSPYFAPGFPADPEAAFRDKLVPFVHGPDMDVFPETIPPENIERAGKILERWTALRPESDGRTHERAWLDFLRADYTEGVRIYGGLARKIDAGAITDPWLRFDVYLNLGRSYDLLGERKKALECYARSQELISGTRWERAKGYIFQDYLKVPYSRGKKK